MRNWKQKHFFQKEQMEDQEQQSIQVVEVMETRIKKTGN